MNLFIPINWKDVDLLTTEDANDFGEALRGYCFIGRVGEKGCYSTFKISEFFKKMNSGKIYEEAKNIIQPEFEHSLIVHHFKINEEDCYITSESGEYKIGEPFEIVCAWEWQGDGTLYFRFNNRKVINTDCKCSYYWNWIK